MVLISVKIYIIIVPYYFVLIIFEKIHVFLKFSPSKFSCEKLGPFRSTIVGNSFLQSWVVEFGSLEVQSLKVEALEVQ